MLSPRLVRSLFLPALLLLLAIVAYTYSSSFENRPNEPQVGLNQPDKNAKDAHAAQDQPRSTRIVQTQSELAPSPSINTLSLVTTSSSCVSASSSVEAISTDGISTDGTSTSTSPASVVTNNLLLEDTKDSATVTTIILESTDLLPVYATSTSATPTTIPIYVGKPFNPSSNVLLFFKTGASTLWRRMPLHLTTTLAQNNIPNVAIYSDLEEQLSSNLTCMDVLANVSTFLAHLDPEAHASYADLQSPEHINTYHESARLPGDEPRDNSPGNPPGWRLDKYKFVPMLSHAARTWPDLKWYIYMEDDTYVFWDSLLNWLNTRDPYQSAWYGAFSGEGNATFAQGGSGIVFSGALMRDVWANEDTAPSFQKYGSLMADSCCGDMILGHILRDAGVPVNEGRYGSISFRPEPPWRTGFDEYMWCLPVFSFHHLHQRDLVEISALEQSMKARSFRASPSSPRPVIFRDVFTALIQPHLKLSNRTNWDNFASQYVLINETANPRPLPADVLATDPAAFAYASIDWEACAAACQAWPQCMSWRHDTRAETCGLAAAITLGREMDPLPPWEETVVVSGWIRGRMQLRLIDEKCSVVGESWD